MVKDKQYYIQKAIEKYGQFYDYSQFSFTNASTKGKIICPLHGPFEQSFSEHLRYRCKGCGRDSKKSLVCGMGINDSIEPTTDNPIYVKWHMMLHRCQKDKDKQVCSQWLLYSTFAGWITEYKSRYYPDIPLEDLDLDKDLFSNPGEQLYSPETCCLIPPKINKLLGTGRKLDTKYLPRTLPKYIIKKLIGCSLEEPKIGDRFYMQQGLSVSDFKLGTFKNKPTKAAVVDEIKKVLPFIGPKTFANTTNLANLLEVVEWLKSEKFVVTAAPGTLPIANKKQPYMDAIADSSSFTEPSLLKLFTIQGLRDFVRFINNEAGNS